MFKSYWKMAIRNIAKNKLYAFVNILGLAIGLTVFLFGGMLAKYEREHDVMFANHERTYIIGSTLTANANLSVNALDNTYSAVAPLIEHNLIEAEEVARTINRTYLLSHEDKHFHQRVAFADKSLTRIFDFEYLDGTQHALDDPNGLILTRDIAVKMFGTTEGLIGKAVSVNHGDILYVSAIIENLPKNSHLSSSLLADPTDIFASLATLNRIDNWDMAGNWYNISTGNQVYVMTKQAIPLQQLDEQINAIFKQHAPEYVIEGFMSGLKARPLKAANTAIWEMIGMPVIESVQVLGLLVLIIAIVNYTNLATAQSMGRSREVGLRKTLGANKPQLMVQFLFESITVAVIATTLAMVLLEIIVPLFNNTLGKVLTIDYLTVLPFVTITALVAGLVAGLYPSYLITKVSPVNGLKNLTEKGTKRTLFRSIMLGAQFMLSIFMLAIVLIVLFQNQKVKESANVFPNDEVIVLERTGVDLIKDREEVLRNELLSLKGVSRVTFTDQVPFEQSNNSRGVSNLKGDVDNEVKINVISVDHDFLKTFDVNLVAGRDFSRDILSDERVAPEQRVANVIINELMSQRLGYTNPNDIVGKTIWGMPGEQGAFQYNVIGVMEDKNFLGLHNEMKAWLIAIHPGTHRFGAIRVNDDANANTIKEIEQVWRNVIPEYPIEHRALSALFYDIYKLYQTMSSVLAGFASIALLLALIGLFGLAAFMAKGKTKEIGIRKVLGASVLQVVNLILWQFSKPIMWAIVFALPLAYLASNMYLQFFAERISFQIPLILIAGLVAVLLAWGVISLHAFSVAKANPIKALRYE